MRKQTFSQHKLIIVINSLLSNVKLCGKTFSHVVCVLFTRCVALLNCYKVLPITYHHYFIIIMNCISICVCIYAVIKVNSFPFLAHYTLTLKRGLVVCQYWKQVSQDPTPVAAQVGVKLMWKSISRVAKKITFFFGRVGARVYTYCFQLDA